MEITEGLGDSRRCLHVVPADQARDRICKDDAMNHRIQTSMEHSRNIDTIDARAREAVQQTGDLDGESSVA